MRAVSMELPISKDMQSWAYEHSSRAFADWQCSMWIAILMPPARSG